MTRYNSILEAIGQTPLIKLNAVTGDIASSVYVKAEFLNPAGSLKDRVAAAMIEAAEKDGLLKPGGTIIEATDGNTGLGLALVASVKKYHCIFVMPGTTSAETINLLRSYGAEVVLAPGPVTGTSTESCVSVAERLTHTISGAYRPDQFINARNPEAHYLGTGPEIWRDAEGRVDVFVAGIGTGGSLTGTAKYLKERNPELSVVAVAADGPSSSPLPASVQGIVDETVRVSERESFLVSRRLAREEGLLVGTSSGAAVAAALKYARNLENPKNIVVLLPDSGRNYPARTWLETLTQENGVWDGRENRPVCVKDILAFKRNIPPIISVQPHDLLKTAIRLMHRYNISQLPVIDQWKAVGSLSEDMIMKLLADGIDFSNQEVYAVMGPPLPQVYEEAEIAAAHGLLLSGTPGIIVTRFDGSPVDVLTRSDIIDFLLQRKEGSFYTI